MWEGVYFFFAASSSAFCETKVLYVSRRALEKVVRTNLGGTCLAGTLMPGVGPLVTESAISLEFTLLLGNLAGSLMNVEGGESKLSTGSLSLEVVAL